MEFQPSDHITHAPWPLSQFLLIVAAIFIVLAVGSYLTSGEKRRGLGVGAIVTAVFAYLVVSRAILRDGIQDGIEFLSSYPPRIVELVLAATTAVFVGFWYVLSRRFRRAA